MPQYSNSLVVLFKTNQKQDPQRWPPLAVKGMGDVANSLSGILGQIGGGSIVGQLAANVAVPATGSITFTSGTGAVGATINGTLKTVTWATSDLASMLALIAAINADTTVNKQVIAYLTSPATQTTPATAAVEAVLPGELGNNVTLVLSGTGVTVSGAKLTGGLLGAVNAISNGV